MSTQIEPLPTDPDSPPEPKPTVNFGRRYTFRLTQGGGIPVCVAYQQRLNQTVFRRPPYCGRPETHRVPDFEYLHRRQLTEKELEQLSPMAMSLFSHQPSLRDPKPVNQLQYSASSWRYDPMVDVDNDGIADNIVIWDTDDDRDASCGLPYGPEGVLGRGGQFGLVLNATGSSIDETQTNIIFGQQGLDPKEATKSTYPSAFPQFQPIGVALGVFRYRKITYFDTFFDYVYRVGAAGPDSIDTQLENKLGVFMRRGKITRQVCQYELINSED